jgi:hypothetical protein
MTALEDRPALMVVAGVDVRRDFSRTAEAREPRMCNAILINDLCFIRATTELRR